MPPGLRADPAIVRVQPGVLQLWYLCRGTSQIRFEWFCHRKPWSAYLLEEGGSRLAAVEVYASRVENKNGASVLQPSRALSGLLGYYYATIAKAQAVSVRNKYKLF